MKFVEQAIKGVYLLESDPFWDERGGFERISCLEELKSIGFNGHFVQNSISINKYKNTLRGMHYQLEPYAEEKLIKCIKGKIYDVVLDLRDYSLTKHKWIAVELSDKNRRSLFIPKGCAHGFLTLENDTHVLYQISNYYSKNHAVGVNYLDKTINIEWPIKDETIIISEKDENLSYI